MAGEDLEEVERLVLACWNSIGSKGFPVGEGPFIAARLSRQLFEQLWEKTSVARYRVLFWPGESPNDEGLLLVRGDGSRDHCLASAWLGRAWGRWADRTGLDDIGPTRCVTECPGTLIEYDGKLEQVDFCVMEAESPTQSFEKSKPVFVGEVCAANESVDSCVSTVCRVVDSGVARVAVGVVIKKECFSVFVKRPGCEVDMYNVEDAIAGSKHLIQFEHAELFSNREVLDSLAGAGPWVLDLQHLKGYVFYQRRKD